MSKANNVESQGRSRFHAAIELDRTTEGPPTLSEPSTRAPVTVDYRSHPHNLEHEAKAELDTAHSTDPGYLNAVYSPKP